MPDKKISEFQTFAGATGEDVFFIVASGESENSSAKNYKIPYGNLKSDLGLDAGGGGSIIGGDQDNIDFGGTEPGDVRNINFQQDGENVMVINEDGDVNIQNDLTVTGNISGGIISGKTGVFTESLTISGFSVLTGFEVPGGGEVIGGDEDNIDFGGTDPEDVRNINFQQGGENVMVINEDGDVNIQNDLTVTGNISGGIISGKTGVFTESLTISGQPVSTGAGGTVGGLPVVGGDEDNIDFGGTEPGDDRPINFQQDGENVMVINQDGDVNIQNDLTVTGNISGGIISGKTGVFTESLSVSGVSVLTGNQQASIQWLEDIGDGQLTVKESSIDGINFTNTKWYDTIQAGGDIYYDEGNVGVNNNNPQAELDVSGDIYSERIKIGNVIVYSDANDNLIFDTAPNLGGQAAPQNPAATSITWTITDGNIDFPGMKVAYAYNFAFVEIQTQIVGNDVVFTVDPTMEQYFNGAPAGTISDIVFLDATSTQGNEMGLWVTSISHNGTTAALAFTAGFSWISLDPNHPFMDPPAEDANGSEITQDFRNIMAAINQVGGHSFSLIQ
jgi:hypothetical protein